MPDDVHLERDYRATPEQLWTAWTDPESLARWLGTPAGPLLTATTPVRMIMGDDEDQWVDIQVVTAEPPRLLELTWDFPGLTGSRLRVEFKVIDTDRTRVIVDHNNLGTSATGYGAGWQAYLEGALAAHFGEPIKETWDELFARNLPQWRERA